METIIIKKKVPPNDKISKFYFRRKFFKEHLSSQSTKKVDDDYLKTKNDFYRMNLHKYSEFSDEKKENLRQTCLAYLQNTPGENIFFSY